MQTMHDFALKHVAREIAESAGVPVLKGSGLVGTPGEAVEAAEVIGYPVLLKATGGGGGRWVSGHAERWQTRRIDYTQGAQRVVRVLIWRLCLAGMQAVVVAEQADMVAGRETGRQTDCVLGKGMFGMVHLCDLSTFCARYVCIFSAGASTSAVMLMKCALSSTSARSRARPSSATVG